MREIYIVLPLFLFKQQCKNGGFEENEDVEKN